MPSLSILKADPGYCNYQNTMILVINVNIPIGSGVDFNSNPFSITIAPGATEGRNNISVACDDEVEGLEFFDMSLTLTSSGNGVTLGRDTSEGQIIDSTGK